MARLCTIGGVIQTLQLVNLYAAAICAVVLKGQFGRVEKLNPARHGDDLWHATGGHDRIWTYMSYGPFADAKTFSRWLVERAALADPFAYAVINQTGR